MTQISSQTTQQLLKKKAKEACKHIDVDAHSYGGKYVSLELTMIIQHKLNERDIKVIWNTRGNDIPEDRVGSQSCSLYKHVISMDFLSPQHKY